ncbi:MAG: NAD(P)H-dependent oxidoreductase [Bacteroidetes bacterium]|nr:NAD(P)H-dependent oxidoreductase [Bacteroidota bacterium]
MTGRLETHVRIDTDFAAALLSIPITEPERLFVGDASAIRLIYHQRALHRHPDRNPDPQAAEVTSQIHRLHEAAAAWLWAGGALGLGFLELPGADRRQASPHTLSQARLSGGTRFGRYDHIPGRQHSHLHAGIALSPCGIPACSHELHHVFHTGGSMYKTKPCMSCDMPANQPLNVLVLNGSLQHEPEISNTDELSRLAISCMEDLATVHSEVIRLADRNIPVGLGFRESPDDEWPEIVGKIKAADIVIFATPIWWGSRSSLIQRAIERLDALDEEYHASGRSALYNKVAGIVITGSEDGALSTMGSIMMVLTWMGFTLPPECAAYWVGEVGFPPADDRAKRLMNGATSAMAKNMARNLVYYAQLLKANPLEPKKE